MKEIAGIKIYRLLALLLIFCTGVSPFFAQITIGSRLKPNEGALLDLKEHVPKQDNSTSSRGLLLPRVNLKMLNGELSETMGRTEPLSAEMHTGLAVYAIADPECPLYKDGVYIWNGSEWIGMGIEKPKSQYAESTYSSNPVEEIGFVTDYEGNTYPTKRFVKLDADGTVLYDEVWTTRNLRSLKDKNGLWIDCPGGVYFNPALSALKGNQPVKATIEIPDGTIPSYTNASVAIVNQSYNDFVGEFGFLYTLFQARRACPQGWHLPAAQEWKDLINIGMGGAETALYPIRENGGKNYATQSGSSYSWGIADYTPNGFNAIPAGYIDITEAAKENPVKAFGDQAIFMGEGSTGTNNTLVSVHASDRVKEVAIGERSSFLGSSVRCIKDK